MDLDEINDSEKRSRDPDSPAKEKKKTKSSSTQKKTAAEPSNQDPPTVTPPSTKKKPTSKVDTSYITPKGGKPLLPSSKTSLMNRLTSKLPEDLR